MLQACRCFETYTIGFPSASRLQWDPSRLWRTSAHWGISLFLPPNLYMHADASKSIPFNSPHWADSNETLPDSGWYLLTEVSPFRFLLTSIVMQTLEELYYPIPLTEHNPRHSVPTLSDHWLKGYPYLCTLVPQASTFTLLAPECYRHTDISRTIPFNSPCRADSNETLPDSGRHPPLEVSASFSLLTSTAMKMLRNLHYPIPLDRRIPTHPVPTLSDPWLKGYLYLCTLVPQVRTFTLLATECYSHADTLRPISFNSPHQVNSNISCPGLVGGLLLKLSPLLYFYSPLFVTLVRLPLRTSSRSCFLD